MGLYSELVVIHIVFTAQFFEKKLILLIIIVINDNCKTFLPVIFMNKNFSIPFLIALFFTGNQIITISSSELSPEKLKYIALLPEGKIREYCEKELLRTSEGIGLINGGLVRVLNRLIWAAVKEKEWDSMTKSEKLAFKDISIIWLSDNNGHLAIYPIDWKKNDFEAIRKVVSNIVVREMILSPDQEHQEVAKVINKFVEFRENVEKAKRGNHKNKEVAPSLNNFCGNQFN